MQLDRAASPLLELECTEMCGTAGGGGPKFGQTGFLTLKIVKKLRIISFGNRGIPTPVIARELPATAAIYAPSHERLACAPTARPSAIALRRPK